MRETVDGEADERQMFTGKTTCSGSRTVEVRQRLINLIRMEVTSSQLDYLPTPSAAKTSNLSLLFMVIDEAS